MKSKSLRYPGIALLGLAGLYAIGSFDGLVDSVHFYSDLNDETTIDFGRAPIHIRMTNWTSEPHRGGTLSTSDWDIDVPQPWDSGWVWNQNRIRKIARNLEIAGKFDQALSKYKMLTPNETLPGFLKDREEIFQQSKGKNAPALQKYLQGRYLVEFGERKRGLESLHQIQNPPAYLKPHILYALADEKSASRNELSNAYMAAYRADQKSPRAESALVMAARTLLQHRPNQSPTPDQVSRGGKLLDQLLKEFPKTRFAENAIGWQGRVAFLESQYPQAINQYRKQTASKDPAIAWMAYNSLADVYRIQGRQDEAVIALLKQWNLNSPSREHLQGGKLLKEVFEKLDSNQAKRVQNAIRKNSDLLQAYIGFRIEHTPLSLTQETNLMTFATSALNEMKNPPASLTSRVAQINYNAGRYASAQQLAQRALTLTADKETSARSRFVLAGSLARTGNHKQAIREGEKLLGADTPGYLRQGAAEFLALQNERHGDPLTALDLYLGLGYSQDAAYLVDARLTPDELKRYLVRKPKYAMGSLAEREGSYYAGIYRKETLQYTLGMRFLRKERYAEARQAFQRLDKATRSGWGLTSKERKALVEPDKNIGYDKAPRVQDPLIIVQKLENLTRISKQAKTENERAQALYDKAAYIYKERNLLFYSPGIWQGGRAVLFDHFWSPEVNNAADKAALNQHLNEHECLAQSLRLTEELIQKYPKSKVMPKALYMAALSAERLSNLNTTWRKKGEELIKVSINRLDRLVKDYPEDSLAKPAAKYKKEFTKQLNRPEY